MHAKTSIVATDLAFLARLYRFTFKEKDKWLFWHEPLSKMCLQRPNVDDVASDPQTSTGVLRTCVAETPCNPVHWKYGCR